jgi:hypothetical protein
MTAIGSCREADVAGRGHDDIDSKSDSVCSDGKYLEGTSTTDGNDFSPRRASATLASQETKAVRRLKVSVIFSLLLSMIAVAFTAYYLTSQQEEDQFKDAYYGDAHKVMSAMGENLERTLQAADAFVSSMASHAQVSNQTWPFVVIPDFAVRAEKVRELSKAVLVNLFQVVERDQRDLWENYTTQVGKAWVDESISVVENFEGIDWPIVWNYTLWDVIHGYDEFDKENAGEDGINTTGPWLPMWQTQPTIAHEPPYNW